MALFFGQFEEEGMIANDVLVVQTFYLCKVPFEEKDMLAIQSDRFHCKNCPFALSFLNTLPHDSVCALPYLLSHLKPFQKHGDWLLRRGCFTLIFAKLSTLIVTTCILLYFSLHLSSGLVKDREVSK